MDFALEKTETANFGDDRGAGHPAQHLGDSGRRQALNQVEAERLRHALS